MLAKCGFRREDASRISWLQWYQYKFNRSILRLVVEAVNTLMSVISVSVYVYDTYITINNVARVTYFICSCTFSVEYVAKLLAATDKLRYLFWNWSLIDMSTIIYGFIYFASTSLSAGFGFIRLLRIIQVVRLCKAVTSVVLQYSRRTSQPMQLEFVRRSSDLAVTLVAVVFISGCVFYELEVAQQDLELHNAIYWSCVTIATIGYGDYAPETVAGQLLFPLIIIVIILVLPRKISDLFEVMQSFSRFTRRSHRSHRFGLHVILTGHVNPLSAQTFIGEFYHQGRGYQELDMVVLCPHDPAPQLVITMNNPRWERRVKYLNGSPFHAEDLARADAGRALAVFVLANKYAADPAAEDGRTLLAVLAIAQFLRQFGSPEDLPPPRVLSWSTTSWKGRHNQASSSGHPHIIAQFLLSETLDNAIALLQTGAHHPPEMGLIPLNVSPFPICVGSLRAALLGSSLHTPGLITLICNLCISCSLERKKSFRRREDVSMLTNCGWLSEYLKGASVGIYDVSFPKHYWGCTFQQAALQLWREEQVILIGLRFPCHDDPEQWFDVKLAPLAQPQQLHPEGDAQVPDAAACAANKVKGGGAAGEERPPDFSLMIDQHTVGYILSDDALVLGSATRGFIDAVNAHEEVEAMQLGSVYFRHQHQQVVLQRRLTALRADGGRPLDVPYVSGSLTSLATQAPGAGAAHVPTHVSTHAAINAGIADIPSDAAVPNELPAAPAAPAGTLPVLADLRVHSAPGWNTSRGSWAHRPMAADSGGGAEPAAAVKDSLPSVGVEVGIVGPSQQQQQQRGSNEARLQASSAQYTNWLVRQSALVAKIFSGQSEFKEGARPLTTRGATGAGSGAAAGAAASAAAQPAVAASTAPALAVDGSRNSFLTRGRLMSMLALQDAAAVEFATSTKRQQGLKAATKALDLHALAAVNSFTYKRAITRRVSRQSTGLSTSVSELVSPAGPRRHAAHTTRRPLAVSTFMDGAQLDSPVIIMGSSCFNQLVHLVAAIRSAPPVGHSCHFRTCAIVIIADGEDETGLSANQLDALGSMPDSPPESLFVLRANPRDEADLGKLNLKPGGMVHGLIVPARELYTEAAVMGTTPALADGHMLLAASALRRHCEEMDCQLRVVTEVLALLNCSYALPLCLSEGPYHTKGRDPLIVPDPSQHGVTPVHFVTDPRPDFRRGLEQSLMSLRQPSDQARQEDFVQHMLSKLPHLAPSLAPGHILMQTFMDALSCQTIFNPMMLQILLKMLNCWGDADVEKLSQHQNQHHHRHHRDYPPRPPAAPPPAASVAPRLPPPPLEAEAGPDVSPTKPQHQPGGPSPDAAALPYLAAPSLVSPALTVVQSLRAAAVEGAGDDGAVPGKPGVVAAVGGSGGAVPWLDSGNGTTPAGVAPHHLAMPNPVPLPLLGSRRRAAAGVPPPPAGAKPLQLPLQQLQQQQPAVVELLPAGALAAVPEHSQNSQPRPTAELPAQDAAYGYYVEGPRGTLGPPGGAPAVPTTMPGSTRFQAEAGVTVQRVPRQAHPVQDTYGSGAVGGSGRTASARSGGGRTAANEHTSHAGASVSNTVRLFCLNYGKLLGSVAGLLDALHVAQQQRHQGPAVVARHGVEECAGGVGGPRDSDFAAGFADDGGDLGVASPEDWRVRTVTFGVLFEVLLGKYGMVPLGLYRRDCGEVAQPGKPAVPERQAPDSREGTVFGSLAAAAVAGVCGGGGEEEETGAPPHRSKNQKRGSGMPYVYTKPGKDTTWLRPSDDVYVLASLAVVVRVLGEAP